MFRYILALYSILQLGNTPFYKRLIGSVVRTKVSKVEEGFQKAPTKPILMTLEFVSVTLEIFGGALPRLVSALPQNHVLSPWSVFFVIRDK